jgi:hypothetical protein
VVYLDLDRFALWVRGVRAGRFDQPRTGAAS